MSGVIGCDNCQAIVVMADSGLVIGVVGVDMVQLMLLGWWLQQKKNTCFEDKSQNFPVVVLGCYLDSIPCLFVESRDGQCG